MKKLIVRMDIIVVYLDEEMAPIKESMRGGVGQDSFIYDDMMLQRYAPDPAREETDTLQNAIENMKSGVVDDAIKAFWEDRHKQ